MIRQPNTYKRKQASASRARLPGKKPRRTCVGCGQAGVIDDLIRCVGHVSGHVEFDVSRRALGRGVWVHPRLTCLAQAERRGFARSLRRQLSLTLGSSAVALRQAAESHCQRLLASGEQAGSARVIRLMALSQLGLDAGDTNTFVDVYGRQLKLASQKLEVR